MTEQKRLRLTDSIAISDPDLKRLIEQVGTQQMTAEDAVAAIDEIRRIHVAAGLWQLWTDGRVEVRWDPKARELAWYAREAAPRSVGRATR